MSDFDFEDLFKSKHKKHKHYDNHHHEHKEHHSNGFFEHLENNHHHEHKDYYSNNFSKHNHHHHKEDFKNINIFKMGKKLLKLILGGCLTFVLIIVLLVIFAKNGLSNILGLVEWGLAQLNFGTEWLNNNTQNIQNLTNVLPTK